MFSEMLYEGKVWIQCENSNCLKWRLLPHDNATYVDPNEPWYCYMNSDPQFNKCSVSEQYFPKESQFQKHGLKYVYSELPLGSLVLVKTQTWPRWPGILCPDPVDSQYVKYDLDGDVESHHVEFLGKPHSRGWAAMKHIDHYPSSFKPDVCKRKKAWYKSALEEANTLFAYSAQERLEMCYLSKKGTAKEKEAKSKTGTIICKKMIKGKRMLTCSLEIASSEDILSAENLVVSETEIILKDLDQILKHVAAISEPSSRSFVDGEDNNVREEVTSCCMEFTEKRPMEINTQEDCIIIDGKAFKAGECIESITDRFKEIDSLMAEFQDSL
ncbi:zinc finger CW-type PWWP domain protein 2 [Varanus komodoensis]|uniref:zinc finger CW-type PWWP domain protein 2 n=1 Tax=Varanus komodoensis TaxID=61221 RepID=UPI001CF7CE82|nr:zinc finger CW-type PWWP domain protein 2 [Varanus komodoensis]